MTKKAELLKEAKDLGLEVTEKNTIKELEELLDQSNKGDQDGINKKTNQEDITKEEIASEDEVKVAKAGKRSAKAIAEAEADAEKEDRKAAIRAGELEESSGIDGSSAVLNRGPVPVTRTKLERRGKRYQNAVRQIDATKDYDLKSGLELAVKSSTVKFDASVEMHIKLNVDPKQADQNIRSTVILPHGTGKTLRVAVFAPEESHNEAKDAGADIVGEADFLKQLDKEQIDFDVLVAHPMIMAKLGRYAKILGPKGLMPNPKSGTVTKNIGEAVKKAKAGQVEFRIDAYGIIHQQIGKVSFGAAKLNDNAEILVKAIKDSKPASVKAGYIISTYVCSSMGPSVKVKL